MDFIKNAWLKFRQLKTWLQIVIVLVLISLFGAVGGSGSSSTNSDSKIPSNSNSSADPTPESSIKATPTVSDAEFKLALSKMRIVKDDVKNLKFYYDKTSPKYVNANGFAIYAGQESGSDPYLYLKIQYCGSDWLFINSFFFNISVVCVSF